MTVPTGGGLTGGGTVDGAPNPGSREAIEQGCICPRLDNNNGKFPPWPSMIDEGGGWWIASDCPLHGLNRPAGRSP